MSTPVPVPFRDDAPSRHTASPADAAGRADGCRFDPDATRAWLTSMRSGGERSVAEVLHIVDDFDLSGFHKAPRIDNLLAEAQSAGVFGVTDHTIAILHLAGEHGFADRHRVTLTIPGHAVLCSDDLSTADLFTDHLSGVDAAVHLLAQTAHATDTLLRQRALLAQVGVPMNAATPDPPGPALARNGSPRGPGRAFRPLALADEAAPPSAPVTYSHATGSRRQR